MFGRTASLPTYDVPTTEATFVARARAGDGAAFASLVREHLPLIYRVAHRACGDAMLAEDAVQETLAIAHRRLGQYQADTSLKSFLLAIAVTQAHTLLRAERRRHLRESKFDAPEVPDTPESHARASALAERVRSALSAMPTKRRDAAILRLDGGLSYAEIATALATSEGSARVLVHLALRELEDRLKEDLVP